MNLFDILEARRQDAGLSYRKFAELIDTELNDTTLFRFMTGRHTGIDTVRHLAIWAAELGDTELLAALSEYALGINLLGFAVNDNGS